MLVDVRCSGGTAKGTYGGAVDVARGGTAERWGRRRGGGEWTGGVEDGGGGGAGRGRVRRTGHGRRPQTRPPMTASFVPPPSVAPRAAAHAAQHLIPAAARGYDGWLCFSISSWFFFFFICPVFSWSLHSRLPPSAGLRWVPVFPPYPRSYLLPPPSPPPSCTAFPSILVFYSSSPRPLLPDLVLFLCWGGDSGRVPLGCTRRPYSLPPPLPSLLHSGRSSPATWSPRWTTWPPPSRRPPASRAWQSRTRTRRGSPPAPPRRASACLHLAPRSAVGAVVVEEAY